MATLNESIIYLPDNVQFEWNYYSANEQTASSHEITIYTQACDCLNQKQLLIHKTTASRNETIISLQISLAKPKFNV